MFENMQALCSELSEREKEIVSVFLSESKQLVSKHDASAINRLLKHIDFEPAAVETEAEPVTYRFWMTYMHFGAYGFENLDELHQFAFENLSDTEFGKIYTLNNDGKMHYLGRVYKNKKEAA